MYVLFLQLFMSVVLCVLVSILVYRRVLDLRWFLAWRVNLLVLLACALYYLRVFYAVSNAEILTTRSMCGYNRSSYSSYYNIDFYCLCFYCIILLVVTLQCQLFLCIGEAILTCNTWYEINSISAAFQTAFLWVYSGTIYFAVICLLRNMVVVYMLLSFEIYIDQVKQPTHFFRPHKSRYYTIFYHKAIQK